MRIDAEVTEGRSLAWPLGGGVLSAGLLCFVATQKAVTASTFVAIALLLTALSFVALSRAAPGAKRRLRRVGADTRGLLVDGALVLSRDAIVQTRVKEKPDGTLSVIVEGRGLRASRIIHVTSPRVAQALADTLDPTTHDVAEFVSVPPWAHRMRSLTLMLMTAPWIVLNVLQFMPRWSFGIVLALYAVIAVPMLVPQTVTVGDDGILLRWAGRRRFLPFRLLREARGTPLGVELSLDDERDVEIRLTHRDHADEPRRKALLTRIEKGLAQHRALGPADDEAVLARGARKFDAWMEAMQTLGRSSQDYRSLAIPRERLWAILENPAVDPSARQGAALALRAGLDDEERERLVTIAQRSASPRVRVAVDAIARVRDGNALRAVFEESDSLEQQDLALDARHRR